jgi:thymidine phosphorylase
VAKHSGIVRAINNRSIDELARSLGAPDDKVAGLHLKKRLKDRVIKGEVLYTCYAKTTSRLQLAAAALKHVRVFTIGK